jgi:ribosomal protein S18 acetylase RimI-like enzyme
MTTQHRIRAATRDDADAAKVLAVASGLFAEDELGGFGEMLSGCFDGSLDDHSWLVHEGDDGEVVGAAYYAPEPFSDRMWNLYFLAVMPEHQGSGTGGVLIEHVEQTLRDAGENHDRVLIVETSDLDRFEPTREFYRKHGFDEEARIRQFYGPDDDKIVFWKSLVA